MFKRKVPALLHSDEKLRNMYRGARANAHARRLSRFWAAVIRLGLLPERWVTLEVLGRKSGRPTRFPLGIARDGAPWYLVSMLGEDCNRVRNVRGACGEVLLWRRRAIQSHLTEVPVTQRARILKLYLAQVPGARPHVPIESDAPVAAFETIAARYPVFRVNLSGPTPSPPASG